MNKVTKEISCCIRVSALDFKQAGIVMRDFKLVKSLLEGKFCLNYSLMYFYKKDKLFYIGWC